MLAMAPLYDLAHGSGVERPDRTRRCGVPPRTDATPAQDPPYGAALDARRLRARPARSAPDHPRGAGQAARRSVDPRDQYLTAASPLRGAPRRLLRLLADLRERP